MMQDWAMVILDVASNAIRAQAAHVVIRLTVSEKADQLVLIISDDGCGMDAVQLKQAVDPFYTTRTTRRVGLGLPFFKGIADQCGGRFTLKSKPGVGTQVELTIPASHWDAPPLGNIAESITALIQASPTIEWIFDYQTDKGLFHFDSAEIQAELEDVSLQEPMILIWIRDYISEQIQALQNEGGAL